MHAGSHDITDVTVNKAQSNAVEVTALYSKHSDAEGALFEFVFIDDRNAVNFTRSAVLALARNVSNNYILPFKLFPGQYRVLVYDIEHDRTLSNGTGYPAATDVLITSEASLGKSEEIQNMNVKSSLKLCRSILSTSTFIHQQLFYYYCV